MPRRYKAETKMPGFPTQTVGTPTNRGKARRYRVNNTHFPAKRGAGAKRTLHNSGRNLGEDGAEEGEHAVAVN
jgi:hypothetical protein